MRATKAASSASEESCIELNCTHRWEYLNEGEKSAQGANSIGLKQEQKALC